MAIMVGIKGQELTLMAEELAQEGLVVDHETLRRWELATGQWTVGRRRQRHRQWRERKSCFGAIVQLDGSQAEPDCWDQRRAIVNKQQEELNNSRERFRLTIVRARKRVTGKTP
jgi:hypothetical protein